MYYTGVGGFWLGVQPRLNHVWYDAAEAGSVNTWAALGHERGQWYVQWVLRGPWVPRGPWVTHTRCEWVPPSGLGVGAGFWANELQHLANDGAEFENKLQNRF